MPRFPSFGPVFGLLVALLGGVAIAQPVRMHDAPGAPPFTVLDPGVSPPLDARDNFVVGPAYRAAPEWTTVAGVPRGRVEQFVIDSRETRLFNPGIARKNLGPVDPTNPKTLLVDTHPVDYRRAITVYIPAGYQAGHEAPFMVVHDGPGPSPTPASNLQAVLDNLIAQRRIPPLVVIHVQNGGGDAQGSERGREYDTMSGAYATFIEEEVLPRVERHCQVRLTADPDGRAVMGNSSGGACALSMAWFRNDLYRRVLATSGTFVNQAWPFDPAYPDGAWGFHEALIPGTARKPIRIFLAVADRDSFNPNALRDGMHDWVEANHRLAQVLKAKGYEYQYLFCRGSRHGLGDAQRQFLPHAIEWTWRGYEPRDERPRPNIVLVLADDLGIADLGCYGRTDHRTPHLDRLAADGVRFTAASCAQPICSPSRAAIMTGKCPARLNLTTYLPGRPDAPSQKLRQPRIEGFLPLEEVTLAELLQQAGYATGLFGKWHLGGPEHAPGRQGFEVVESSPENTPPRVDEQGEVVEGGKGEFAITAAAERFIEANRDRPFFCYVPHHTPHIPLAAAPALVANNRDAFHPTYAALVETLDRAVGRLRAKVESLGLAERTIFIFTSDNGGLHVLESPGTPATRNRPYRAGKGHLYEGGLREPLLVRWPGVTQPGRVCDTPVVLTDLVPTLLEAAGIDPAKAVGPLDGVSLVGLLRGEALAPRPLCWHFPHYTNQGGRPAGAIREGDWKLVEQFEDGAVELYDLATDVGETRDLAATEPERAARMLAALRDWRTRVGARMPTPAPEFDAALHRRLYVEQDASRLEPAATAAATEPEWQEWRAAMNAVTTGRVPPVTPARGDIRLQARDARVHGDTLRYEPQPNKDVLGYWKQPTDWAEWEFEVTTPGRYEVEIQQGCGPQSGGAEVVVVIGHEPAATTLPFTVQETGHFQQMMLKVIGEVELPAGRHTLAVKPRTKPGVAVMDLRRVVLRPVASR